jgi:hypothetical protein
VAMRSHVDPCTFVVYIHVSGDDLTPDFLDELRKYEPAQGQSPRPLLDKLPPRSQQVQFHESYHYWQGLRLPFLYRYAFIAFRQASMAFAELSRSTVEFTQWDCILPELERLGLELRIARGEPQYLFCGGDEANFPDNALDEFRLSPIGLLECAASLAEFQVSTVGDKASPVEFSRWTKRNPASVQPYEFAARFLRNSQLALRCLLPLINAAFHTSDPVQSFVQLLGRIYGNFCPGGDFGKAFLAQPEPCRWTELFRLWLNELPYDAEADCDGKLLGSPYHRVTLEKWVGGSLRDNNGGFLTHPFLAANARKWIEVEKAIPEVALLMDQPAWVTNETFWKCREQLAPPLTIYRFHTADGRDKTLLTGIAMNSEFTSFPITQPTQWRGFVADMLTMHGAVRRASGAHFDADQRTCYHSACPHYESNFCNSYVVVPSDHTQCGFPDRIHRLIEFMRGN